MQARAFSYLIFSPQHRWMIHHQGHHRRRFVFMRLICYSLRLICYSTRLVGLLVILLGACQSAVIAQKTDRGQTDAASNEKQSSDLDGTRRNGLVPSRDVFSPGSSDVPVDAFLFLSESGSQVVVPGTTWEQLEKLKRLEGGNQSDSDRYVFQSLLIEGSAIKGRAEMEVSVKLNIEPTEGGFAKIPLGMSNFHLIGPAVVSGVTDHAIVVAKNGQGYQWWVRADEASKAELKMKVSARVETAPSDSLRFELPNVPSKVTLNVDAQDVFGEAISGADAVVTSTANKNETTRLLVESSGGDFVLRWNNRRSAIQQKPLLEVESRVDVRWDSPQDQPIASVRLTARNIKGSIERFRLLLPPGSVLLDVPRLGKGGQAIQFVPVNLSSVDSGQGEAADVEENLVDVILPEEEQQQRIDLNFELQLSGGEVSAETPMKMTVPQVVDSLRHRGEMILRLGEEYRLRWETRPWVRSEPVDETEQEVSERTYRFRFDRGSFELPVWLSTKERRLTLSVQSEVIIRDAVASLQMQIMVGGSVVNNMLQIDDASWDVLSIVNQETGQQVETYLVGEDRVLQWGQSNQQEDLVFVLSAQRSLGQDLGDIEFPLPRIGTSENEVVAGESTLDLVGNGRTVMTVDLAASEGLTRIKTSEFENASDATISRFRIARFGEPVNLVGTLQEQPLRITLSPEATVEIDGSQLLSTVDWLIDSPLDLEGRLPIRIPRRRIDRSLLNQSLLDANAIRGLLPSFFSRESSDETLENSLFDRSNVFGRQPLGNQSLGNAEQWNESEDPWVVTVDGVPARLRRLDNDRFELISERLSSGVMSVRWRHRQEILLSGNAKNVQRVAFPRPRIPDVTMRGNFEIQLRGDGQSQLVAIDSAPSGPASGRLAFEESGLSETQFLQSRVESMRPRTRYLTTNTLPREPIRLQLKAQTEELQELSVQQVVLRTAVGHRTRQEQILATIRRGSAFRVKLARSAVFGNHGKASSLNSESTESTQNGSLQSFSGLSAASLDRRYERLAQQVNVEAFVDGDRVSVENREGWLVVDLPGDLQTHTMELNIWIPQVSLSSISDIEPFVQLPSGLGRVFWQVIAPLDSHVVWSSPTVGRAMSWQFDQWRLYRRSSMNDQELARLVGGASVEMPPGNRYLYLGTDLPAFQVKIASRTVLWLIIASTVLLATVTLVYFPVTRHPLTAMIAALLFSGLILVAPDAAVLAGQLGLISLVLVIVMMAIRSLLVPGRHDRVFASTSKTDNGGSSKRILSNVGDDFASGLPNQKGFSETESMRPISGLVGDSGVSDVAEANETPPNESSSGSGIAS